MAVVPMGVVVVFFRLTLPGLRMSQLGLRMRLPGLRLRLPDPSLAFDSLAFDCLTLDCLALKCLTFRKLTPSGLGLRGPAGRIARFGFLACFVQVISLSTAAGGRHGKIKVFDARTPNNQFKRRCDRGQMGEGVIAKR
jgi:hypothetical protein